ncbi:MAG: hypothetical protein ACR2FY_13860 [Pirellulaceae bacterium]
MRLVICVCVLLTGLNNCWAAPAAPTVSVKLDTSAVVAPVFVGDSFPLKIVIENKSRAELLVTNLRTRVRPGGTNHNQPYFDLWLTKPDGEMWLLRSYQAAGEVEENDQPISVPSKNTYTFYEMLFLSYGSLVLDVPGEYRLAVSIQTTHGDFRSGDFVFRVKERDGLPAKELTELVHKIPETHRHQLALHSGWSYVWQFSAPIRLRLMEGNLLRDLELHDRGGEACDRIVEWTRSEEALNEFLRDRIAFFQKSFDPIRTELGLLNIAKMCAAKKRWKQAELVLAELPPDANHSVSDLRKRVAKELAGK